MADKKELRELCRLFLRLGLTAFGGPAAHIAMMQREVVEKRGWMDHTQFLDLIGATNLIPGPNSTEMAIHIGLDRGGWRGLLIAGACFICPAVVMTGVIAWLYQQYGNVPQVSAFIFGIKPVIIPVILAAALPLAKRALKGVLLWVISVAALVTKGLLSRKVLMDAIAVGQFTPGPVFSSVTFIGWQMGGWRSAALATLAIFLPSFVFVALSHPLVPRMRRSKLFAAFLDGVNAASVAIILTVCIEFGRTTITDWRAVVIAVLGGVVVFGFPRVNSAWVILGGSVVGFLLGLVSQ